MSFWGDLFSGNFGKAGQDLDPFARGNIFGAPKEGYVPPVTAPPLQPDYTDSVIKALKQGEAFRQQVGQTRGTALGAGPPQAQLAFTQQSIFGNLPKLPKPPGGL